MQRQNSLHNISWENTVHAERRRKLNQHHSGGCVLPSTDIFLTRVRGTMDLKCRRAASVQERFVELLTGAFLCIRQEWMLSCQDRLALGSIWKANSYSRMPGNLLSFANYSLNRRENDRSLEVCVTNERIPRLLFKPLRWLILSRPSGVISHITAVGVTPLRRSLLIIAA